MASKRETQATKTDIELFAKAYFNIELTSYQLKAIERLSQGRTVFKRMPHDGTSTALNIARAYIAEGLKKNGRARLQLPQLPAHLGRSPKLKGVTQAARVLNKIKQPGGAYNFELSRLALKYTSVISNLRKEGHEIIAERQYLRNGRASNTYKYYLAGRL